MRSKRDRRVKKGTSSTTNSSGTKGKSGSKELCTNPNFGSVTTTLVAK